MLSNLHGLLKRRRANSGDAECYESMALCPLMVSINLKELGKREHYGVKQLVGRSLTWWWAGSGKSGALSLTASDRGTSDTVLVLPHSLCIPFALSSTEGKYGALCSCRAATPQQRASALLTSQVAHPEDPPKEQQCGQGGLTQNRADKKRQFLVGNWPKIRGGTLLLSY